MASSIFPSVMPSYWKWRKGYEKNAVCNPWKRSMFWTMAGDPFFILELDITMCEKHFLIMMGSITRLSRSQQLKTMKAIAWMDSYYQKVGDKRLDKNWVYLWSSGTTTILFLWYSILTPGRFFCTTLENLCDMQ